MVLLIFIVIIFSFFEVTSKFKQFFLYEQMNLINCYSDLYKEDYMYSSSQEFFEEPANMWLVGIDCLNPWERLVLILNILLVI